MKPGRVGAPIALQIGLLIALCLIAAQIVALLVLGFSPPPQPQVYRLGEIASALQGGSLQPRLGRPLLREFSDDPPQQQRPPARRQGERPNFGLGFGGQGFGNQAFGGVAGARGRLALAALIGVDPDRVRIVRPPPSWPARFIAGRFMAAFPRPPQRDPRPDRGDRPRGDGPGFGPPDGGPGLARPDGPDGGLAQGSAGPGPAFDPAARLQRLTARAGDIDIVGNFMAGLQREDGTWVVVTPKPDSFPNDWQRKVGLWMLGCLLLSAPAAWWFARRITAPIDRFAEAAQRLGRDPHAPPMDLGGPAEIGKAAEAFNDMQQRIQRYVDDRTAMVGAISHDLRTPLARIRFKLEAKTPDPVAIINDVQQMEAMIASVLAFIRDANSLDRREKLDLLSVVEVVVDDAALVGGNAQIVEAAPLTVEGDPMALQRLLANLVDNAMKYGGAARVSMAQRDGSAVVEIEDDGPGMASADLARAFEPFYRADASRNLDSGGVGLGLAVSRSLARAHGGDVELIVRPEGGMTARITLPLADWTTPSSRTSGAAAPIRDPGDGAL